LMKQSMKSFYVLGGTGTSTELADVTYKYKDFGTCGTRAWERVGAIRIRFGKKAELLDFVATTDGFFIRQRVVDALTEARLSGWRSGRVYVQAASRLQGEDLDYSELVVVGHTRNYAERTGLLPIEDCPECGLRRYERPRTAIALPAECWDGTDIFEIEELPGLYIVTQAFKDVVDDHGFNGVELTNIDDWLDYPP